jgi:hypothetical protein
LKSIKKSNKTQTSRPALVVAAKEQRSWCPERKRHGTTPNLKTEDDVPTIGNGNRSAGRSQRPNAQPVIMRKRLSSFRRSPARFPSKYSVALGGLQRPPVLMESRSSSTIAPSREETTTSLTNVPCWN